MTLYQEMDARLKTLEDDQALTLGPAPSNGGQRPAPATSRLAEIDEQIAALEEPVKRLEALRKQREQEAARIQREREAQQARSFIASLATEAQALGQSLSEFDALASSAQEALDQAAGKLAPLHRGFWQKANGLIAALNRYPGVAIGLTNYVKDFADRVEFPVIRGGLIVSQLCDRTKAMTYTPAPASRDLAVGEAGMLTVYKPTIAGPSATHLWGAIGDK